MELIYASVIILVALAIFDLTVGVSNDAANFLNSAIGSRVAPRAVILGIASLGILVGVTFSSGMMEVARKSIFHPSLFTMPEILTLFLAVMIIDTLLLDLFNTYGLPTSTTVSIVFELLGAAFAISCFKILESGQDLQAIGEYLNTTQAMVIIMGIMLSIVFAFILGMTLQFFTRFLFTFDFVKNLRRFGALWGGGALAMICYFILIKGSKGASFMKPEWVAYIREHTFPILGVTFVLSAVFLEILVILKVNVLKPVILVGTFALAMAFAANDLVNFIGVPLAGYHAVKAALLTADPLTADMSVLAQKVQSETFLLLLAGVIMVVTLIYSRKTRAVQETEISLGQQDHEGYERFDSSLISRLIVRMFLNMGRVFGQIIPHRVKDIIDRRTNPENFPAAATIVERQERFDLMRAAVNLMTASMIISYATSHKLPLSTTYVTFMVAMGTSFADGAWGRESAVYRITGVLTVVGGWFMTAVLAFTLTALCAVVLKTGGGYAIPFLLAVMGTVLFFNHRTHNAAVKKKDRTAVFNLKKITDSRSASKTSFQHMSYLLREIRSSIKDSLSALRKQDAWALRAEKKQVKLVQKWGNIIIANMFKSMRILQMSGHKVPFHYAQTVNRIQELVDGHRDIVLRAYEHVANHHKNFIPDQENEIQKIFQQLDAVLQSAEKIFSGRGIGADDVRRFKEKGRALRKFVKEINRHQTARISSRESKTRLSILYYSLGGNAMGMVKQVMRLYEIFHLDFGKISSSGTKRR